MSRIQLKGITWDHPRGYDPLVACSREYAKLHNVDVSWEKRSLKAFGDQSIAQLAEQYDLLVIDHPHSGYANSTKCIVPLEPYLDQQVLSQLNQESTGPSFKSYHYKGHQWALPLDAAMQTAAFRPDLHKLSLPKTWNDVLMTDQLGLALCPTDSLCSFLSLTAQFGSPIDEKKTELVDERIGVEVLELMGKLVDKAHPQSLNWNPIQLLDYMSSENDIAYAPMQFSYTNYSRDGFRKHLLQFANPPRHNNALFGAVVGGAGIAISTTCKTPQAAAMYAAWLCSGEIQSTIYTRENGQPANLCAWKNEHANALTQQFFTNTLDTITHGYIRPRFAAWPTFQEYLGDMVHAFLRDKGHAHQVVRHLNQQYKALDRI